MRHLRWFSFTVLADGFVVILVGVFLLSVMMLMLSLIFRHVASMHACVFHKERPLCFTTTCTFALQKLSPRNLVGFNW
jgi:hypothetical protein